MGEKKFEYNNDQDILGGMEETARVTRLTVYHDMLGALMDRALDTEKRIRALETDNELDDRVTLLEKSLSKMRMRDWKYLLINNILIFTMGVLTMLLIYFILT